MPKDFPHRKNIKSHDWSLDKEKRRKRFQSDSRTKRREVVWKKRTEQYQSNKSGVFVGSYSKGHGGLILVRGSTTAKIRYETDSSVTPLRWAKVSYSAPKLSSSDLRLL